MFRTRQLLAAMGTLILMGPLCSVAEETKRDETGLDKTDPLIEETEVIGSRRGNFTQITEDAQKLVDMPGAIGDPIAAVFSLPGVIYSEGDGGTPAVRGSSPEDNRFYADFMQTGYVFHTFTNSIYSEYILHNFQMYSAGFGPEYGNVTGAVFDIELRDPKNQDLETTLDLSMLRSGIFMESAISENSAFYLSYRKSLIHLFIPTGEEEDGIVIEEVPQDSDYQFKTQWDISSEHSIELLLNGADDLAEAAFTRESDFVRSNPDFEGDAKIENNYDGQNIVWEYNGDSDESKIGIGNYKGSYRVNWGDDFFFNYTLNQKSARAHYSRSLGKQHKLGVGASGTKQHYDISYDQILFICTEFETDCLLNRVERVSDEIPLDVSDKLAYINETWAVNDKLTMDIGIQWQSNDYTDEDFTHPRYSVDYQANSNWRLFSKYGKYNRFPDVSLVLPTIGNPDLKSPTASHTTFGIENTLDDGWSWSVELYHKKLKNLPLGLSQEEPDFEQLYSNDVKGEANGVELFVNKTLTDKWYGWVALSYAESKRTNERTGEDVDYYLDTPIVFNWVTNYRFTSWFDVGWRWSVRSGAAYTPVIGVQDNPYFEDAVLPEYDEPYSDRLPIYSRLDIRFKWDFNMGSIPASVIFDVVNALNRKNVTDRSLDYEEVQSTEDPVVTTDTVSNGIIPALSFRMTF